MEDLVPRIDWTMLRSARILVTGGSGFFGRWVLGLWASANHTLGLKSMAVVLTRDPARFARRLPDLTRDPAVTLIAGDAAAFVPPARQYDFGLHLAGEPLGPGFNSDVVGQSDAIVFGAQRMLKIAPSRLLLVSTGAVYGPQPEHEQIPEEASRRLEPSSPRGQYAAAKWRAESDALASGVPTVVARPFAFVGPGYPIGAGFAASQFLADGLAGRPIRVAHGNVVRSYLDAADLAVWLWTILLRGAPGRAYNVGSEKPIRLAELGEKIARQCGVACEVGESSLDDRYVPSTRRARSELGLEQTISINESIERTIRWHREQ